MKSNKNTLLSRLILFLAILLIVSGAFVLWWKDAISAVDPKDSTPVNFEIRPGEGARTISMSLAQENLVRSPTAFFILVKFLGIETELQAGQFRLNRTMSSTTIAQELTHGTLDVWVTTLEGWRDEEIASELNKDLDIPEQEFLKYSQAGYMFPDTYSIPKNATAAAIAKIFRDNFDKKVTQTMKADAIKTGLTFSQVVTLASIVEREGRTASDRPIIAGILLKRLKADWPLETDATLQFALGYQPEEKSWWKKELTDADKKIDSPYNTYLNAGLPPGPIANPGLQSIKAVIYPVQTDYWYYIHDTKGLVHYAKTLEEHNANVAKYLGQ